MSLIVGSRLPSSVVLTVGINTPIIVKVIRRLFNISMHFFSKLIFKKFTTKSLSYQFLHSIQLSSFCCFEQQSLTLQCSTWKNLIQKPKGKRKRGQVCFAFATLFRRNLVLQNFPIIRTIFCKTPQ